MIGSGVKLRAGLRYSPYDDYNLDVHVRRTARRADGSLTNEAVSGLGIDLRRLNIGSYFGVPFGGFARRDTELDAGAGTSRTFTNDQGVARIPMRGDADSPLPGLSGVRLGTYFRHLEDTAARRRFQ